MTTIRVVCTDQVLTYENTPMIASGGLEENFVQFSFCNQWDGFEKTAVFWRSETEAYHNLLDVSNSCQLPPEVTAKDGVIYLGVFGVDADGRQRTSNVLTYRIEKGAITLETKPSEPTPDIYNQLLVKYQEMKDIAAEVKAAEEAFEEAMTQQQTAHEASVAASQASFQETVTQRQTAHEEAVDADQLAFQETMTQAQDEYEQHILEMIAAGLLPDDSITTAKIKDGVVTKEKLAPDALSAENVRVPSETAASLGISTVNAGLLTLYDKTVPKIGDIKTTIRTDLDESWLLCNGNVIDQATYPDLYNMTAFSIYNQFIPKGIPPIADTDTIAEVYADEDCYVFAVKDSKSDNLTLWWKRRTETEWNSKLVYTVKNASNNSIEAIRISLANEHLCVLIVDEYSSSSQNYCYTHYTWCDKGSFNWSECASGSTTQIHSDKYITPIRYLNGYYVYSAYTVGTNNHLLRLFYKEDITADGSFSAGSGYASNVTWPIDVTYTDGYYRIICGYGKSHSDMRVANVDKVNPTSNFSAPGTDATGGGTHFIPGTDYWFSNDSDGNLLLMKNTTVLKNLNIVASPLTSDMVGDDFYIMCTNCLLKYNLTLGTLETAELNFAGADLGTDATSGFINFAEEFVGVTGSDGGYYESAKALPCISPYGAYAYIKAK